MPVSLANLLRLSEDTYNPGKMLDARYWKLIQRGVGVDGLAYAIYQPVLPDDSKIPAAAHEAVLAFRGSESPFIAGGWQDWFDNDVAIVRMSMPPQAMEAIAVAKQWQRVYPKLTLTGHSLGGALAIIAAAHTGLRAVTFNAPGVMMGCVKSSYIDMFEGNAPFHSLLKNLQMCVGGSNIENHRSDGDVVSSRFLLQVGKTTVYTTSCTFSEKNDFLGIACRHGLERLSDSMQKNEWVGHAHH